MLGFGLEPRVVFCNLGSLVVIRLNGPFSDLVSLEATEADLV